MNELISQSWYFTRSQFKHLILFAFPFIVISVVLATISIYIDRADSVFVDFDKLHLFISIAIYPLYCGGLLILISNISSNESISYKSILRKALSIWVALLIVTILSGLIVGLGFVALIIPGIWLLIRLYLCQLYVIFENKSPIDAIGVSFKASKTHFWKLFSILFPVFVIYILFAILGSFISEHLGLLIDIPILILQELIFIFITVLQFRLYTKYG